MHSNGERRPDCGGPVTASLTQFCKFSPSRRTFEDDAISPRNPFLFPLSKVLGPSRSQHAGLAARPAAQSPCRQVVGVQSQGGDRKTVMHGAVSERPALRSRTWIVGAACCTCLFAQNPVKSAKARVRYAFFLPAAASQQTGTVPVFSYISHVKKKACGRNGIRRAWERRHGH